MSTPEEKVMLECDARRAKARLTASPEQFRRSFINEYADHIELIRRRAIVTEVDDAGNVTAVSVNIPRWRARLTIFFSRNTRWLKRLVGTLKQSVKSGVQFVRRILGLGKTA
jgi:hypothetical protein